MKTAIITAAAAVVALTGCATKQYAQVGTITPYEKTSMSCREIDIEMARTQGVQEKISEEDQFDGRSVLAFLGDWGIGNHMAKSSAEEGVTKRMSELQTMRANKGCGLSTKVTQTD